MSKPRFSVITPILNGREDVPGYVQCLQSQSYTNWEAIIVDDGSRDGSLELLKRLTEDDPRFLITRNTLHKEIAGPYQARNVGLSLATGEFVCFLDIDDRWISGKLTAQAGILDVFPETKLLYSSYLRLRRGAVAGRIRRSSTLQSPKRWIKIANPVPMLTACVQRSMITGITFKAQHHEDYLFWHAVLRRLDHGQIRQDPSALAIYTIHDKSVSSNKLRATYWIWQCYRRLGYGRPTASLALLCRGILQAWLIASEAMQAKSSCHQLE